MNKPHYTIGNKFGRLTILSRGPKYTVFCQCECGTISNPAANDLARGLTRSCGCLQRETVTSTNSWTKSTHQMVHTPTYKSWAAMKSRCSNPNHHAAENYINRGITMCSEWKTFECFYADMGERPLKTTLDRRNNDLGYSKDNCRWATYVEQSNNTRKNVFVEYLGETMSATQWARRKNIPVSTIKWRLTRGWTAERALTTLKKAKAT